MSFGNAIALAGLLFAGLSAILGVWWRMEQRIRASETKSAEDLAKMAEAERAKRESLAKDLAEFKLHASETYSTWEFAKDSERRLADKIEKLSDSVHGMADLVVERITKFLTMKIPNM